MKIALISDELTRASLSAESRVRSITPYDYKLTLRLWAPDILFVESSWMGLLNSWKFKVAAHPGNQNKNNTALKKVVEYAREIGIPTVFWNKEDGVHFERFIDSALLFDHIFTVDSNCIKRYRAVVSDDVTVSSLMFAVQPALHAFSGFNFRYDRANFVGSYSRRIHESRRAWQDMLFSAASDIGVTVYDRNSNRESINYRFPDFHNLKVKNAIPYAKTAQIYKDYLISLNVNTIEDSPTMFSRRLIEILACGGIAVTTPSLAVNRMFADYCHVVNDEEQARELFERLSHGPSVQDLERARAGAELVGREFTWAKRLETIREVIGI